MNPPRRSVHRRRDAAATLFRAGASPGDAGLGHPDLTQFMTELAAAPPDPGPETAPTPARSRPPTRSPGLRGPGPAPADQ